MLAGKQSVKNYYICNLKEGARIEDVFLVASKTIASTRAGSQYLRLKLSDKSGVIDAVKWDVNDADLSCFGESDYAHIVGTVKTYNGDLQVTIDSCRRCDSVNELDLSDFVPSSSRDRHQMMGELSEMLATVKHPHLSRLLAALFNDPEFAHRFSECPAAKSVHHAYLGGLLEHTLNVVRTCAALAELYPSSDRDLLITAAALHDIGKMEEYDWSTSIRIADAGHMVGHLVAGAMTVREVAAGIDGFDPVLSLALQHAILAHHGSKDFGSSKLPKSIEAIILHHADDIDAKVAIFSDAINESDRNGEPGLFTRKVPLLDRPIFRGAREQTNDPSPEPEPEDEVFDGTLFAVDSDYDPFAD